MKNVGFKPPKHGSQPLKIKVLGSHGGNSKISPLPTCRHVFYTRRGHIFSNVIASPKLEFDPAVESWAPAFGRLLSWTDASWWLQPLWNILVKMDHFPNSRGEKHKKSVSCHHVVFLLQAFFGGSFKKIGRDHPPKKWAFGEEIEQTSFGDVYIYICIYGWI